MIIKCLVGKISGDTSYSNWSKDVKHRLQAQQRGIFRSAWPDRNGPLPWRLAKRDRLELVGRMERIVWPHYMERLFYRGYSFWTKPSRMWKCRRKFRLLYFILPIQLRDKVPAVSNALSQFVWAMRRLQGQVSIFMCYALTQPLTSTPLTCL